MSEQNKLLSDRIEPEEERKRGVNLPMILGGLALFGFIGAALWINLGGDDAGRRTGIIPEVNQTPDPRSQGGSLFGTVPTQPLASVEPQQDPRVAVLEAELAELRELIKAAQAEESEPTPEEPNEPTAVLDAQALAALEKRAERQEKALEAFLQKLEEDRLAAERRQRELIARIQANRPVTQPGQTAETAQNGDTEAQRLEAARKAEEERLAQPLTNSLGGGSTGPGTGTGANNSSGNDFLDAAASRSVQTARATQLKDVHRLVPQGRTIPATLETAISSDLPGELRGRVSRDVWSADATTVLIPRGSTLIGEYSSDISLGQRRVLVAWNRVITPDQRSIMIGSRGVDALGRAGLTGNVQHHFGLKFEAAFFISIFSGISSFGNRTLSDNDLSTGTDGFANSGQSAFEEYLSIPPSIWIDQGEQFNVFVSRDLYL
ncbi:TrbI/VirB10 family protein [uncultured Ruegeria sp.]|uniref:TrbI/VirB10 family protein n=1 Tax=uncultured Ruegeria sp. TaxID=259304 RepID=UPI00262F96E5|nr:TrbI/VirB10 family protein [uncultured Ruegeria sp.]